MESEEDEGRKKKASMEVELEQLERQRQEIRRSMDEIDRKMEQVIAIQSSEAQNRYRSA